MAQPQKIRFTYITPQDIQLLKLPQQRQEDSLSSGDEAELKHISYSTPETSPPPSPPAPSTDARIINALQKKSTIANYEIKKPIPLLTVPLKDIQLRRKSLSPAALSVSNQRSKDKPKIVVFSPEGPEEENESKSEKLRRHSVGTLNMTSPRPKSPKHLTPSKKEEQNESFWDKLGTLGRKKKVKEVQDFQTEGQITIDLPGSPYSVDVPPDDYMLDDNEERSMIQPQSLDDPKLKQLVEILIEWVNDELAPDRIIVKHMEEDLYDGMVLHKLIEKLTGITLDVPEVTQSEEGQKQKLRVVLNAVNHTLGMSRYGPAKWSVESVHSKNLIPIVHLLVALVRHFRAPIRLPENVVVNVVIVQKRDGQLNHRIVEEELTGTYDDLGLRCERDAFDTLFDHAPDKLQVVKKSLITFVNKQLNKVNLDVYDLDSEFHDGVYLCLLMGLLEGYFVPLHHFHLTPKTFEEKLHNVSQSFELMMDAGLGKPKARPEDIVNKDLKSTLRVLYNLFTKYKGTN